jgi:alkylhydroperoxidase family enzyme
MTMAAPSYDTAPYPIRDDLVAAHARAWDWISRPGRWWTGAERIAIAAEARNAKGCALCGRRKEALSPAAIEGEHDSLGRLPEAAVEAVHRIVTDPGRLSEGWFEKVIATGLTEEQYVELVSMVAHVTAVDTFTHAIGMPRHPLPAPAPGAPSRVRPKGARKHRFWVSNIEPGDHDPEDSDYFSMKRRANIRLAMTLVPSEARAWFDLVDAQYLSGRMMVDFGRDYRAIDRAQIELIAARVSALNQCTY